MVTVGWILAREFIKLYVARQAKRLGSRIRTKLVVGAMLLSCVPVFFLVLWSYEVLNLNLKAWFTNPVDNQVEVYKRGRAARSIRKSSTAWRSRPPCWPASPKPRNCWPAAPSTPGALQRFARSRAGIGRRSCRPTGLPLDDLGSVSRRRPGRPDRRGPLPVEERRRSSCRHRIPLDAGEQLTGDQEFSDDGREIVGNRKDYRTLYVMLMVLITLFVLFVATWLALFLANRSARRSRRCSKPPARCAAATCSTAWTSAPRTNWPCWCAASTR